MWAAPRAPPLMPMFPGLPSLVTRAHVPEDTSLVTAIGGDEVDPVAVGADPDSVRKVWRAADRLYRSGIHPAIQLCVRVQGETLLDRAIGYARGAGPGEGGGGGEKVPVTPSTPFNMFSAAKAVTAMTVQGIGPIFGQRFLP